MNIHKKLRQLERRVAALEKTSKPFELQIAIQQQKIDQMKLDWILSRRFVEGRGEGDKDA